MKSGRQGKRQRRPHTTASTLVEVLLASLILLFGLSVTFSFGITVARSVSKYQTQADLLDSARRAADEMTLQLRSGSRILSSQSVSGTLFSSSDTSVVFSAPGYDPASGRVILTGGGDVIAFSYSSPQRTLRETIQANSGSRRPARQSYVLARNVSQAVFEYQARDQFRASGSTVFTLQASATAPPAAFVNGVAAACVWSSGQPARATLSVLPASGADVQFIYPINPSTSTAVALAAVHQVNITLQISANDNRQIRRSTSFSCSARLRNNRS